MNCRLGMKAYGLIDENGPTTALGRELYALKTHEAKLYETFARHIRSNLMGMALVQCIRDMTVAGETVTLTSMRVGNPDSFPYPLPVWWKASKHDASLAGKGWSIRGSRWQIDETRLGAVLGINPDDFGVLSRFTGEQRAFLLALANSGINGLSEPNHQACGDDLWSQVSREEPAEAGTRPLGRCRIHHRHQNHQRSRGKAVQDLSLYPVKPVLRDVVTPLLGSPEGSDRSKFALLAAQATGRDFGRDRFRGSLYAWTRVEALAFKLMRVTLYGYCRYTPTSAKHGWSRS